jgi:hypothetical protein
MVYFEEVSRHLVVDTVHASGGFLSILNSWCEDKKIPNKVFILELSKLENN